MSLTLVWMPWKTRRVSSFSWSCTPTWQHTLGYGTVGLYVTSEIGLVSAVTGFRGRRLWMLQWPTILRARGWKSHNSSYAVQQFLLYCMGIVFFNWVACCSGNVLCYIQEVTVWKFQLVHGALWPFRGFRKFIKSNASIVPRLVHHHFIKILLHDA